MSYQKSTIADLNQLLHKIMCTEGFHETNVLLLFKTIKTQGQNIAKFSRKNRKLCRAHCAQNWKKSPDRILEFKLTPMTWFYQNHQIHKMKKKIVTYCCSNFTMLQKLSKCEEGLTLLKIWWFYCHSDFTWNQILVNSNGPNMSFLAILETLNFEFLLNLGLERSSNSLR